MTTDKIIEAIENRHNTDFEGVRGILHAVLSKVMEDHYHSGMVSMLYYFYEHGDEGLVDEWFEAFNDVVDEE